MVETITNWAASEEPSSSAVLDTEKTRVKYKETIIIGAKLRNKDEIFGNGGNMQ